MSSDSLTAALKAEAARLGFALTGACPAVRPTGIERLGQWLAAGYGGQMLYLENRREAYGDPNSVLDGARSILMLAMNYRTAEPATPQPGHGRVSRYAWGHDYHDLIRERLNRLSDFLQDLSPGAKARGVVDSAPLMEREYAQLAGLGWIGKNTLLLNRQMGSWFFLAALLTDLELEYDRPHETDHCGTCRACLDACPTGAFVDAHVLDARKCISYLTIELRSPIPESLRAPMGDWVFGCDICQDVCPWNHSAPLSVEPALAPVNGINPLALAQLFTWDDEQFRARFRETPLWRAKRRGLLRNAAIVLGNQRYPPALPALIRGLNDAEPPVRGACAWALGQFGDETARGALAERLTMETDADVRHEIERSNRECARNHTEMRETPFPRAK